MATTGPPKNDSMKLGTWISGIASFGISVLDFSLPAAFFLLGADDLMVFPSYRCAVSPPPTTQTDVARTTPPTPHPHHL